MTPDAWWINWCLLWYAIGWRRLGTNANYNVEDVLDVCASLMMRVARLEANAQRFPFGGLF